MDTKGAATIIADLLADVQQRNDAVCVAMQMLLRVIHRRLKETGVFAGVPGPQKMDSNSLLFIAAIVAASIVIRQRMPDAISKSQTEYLTTLERIFREAGLKFPGPEEIEINLKFLREYGGDAFGNTIETQADSKDAQPDPNNGWSQKLAGEIGH